MTWLQRYRLRHFLRFSFWLVPLAWMLVAGIALPIVRWLDLETSWRLFNYSEDGARQILSSLSSSMLTFMVFAVSALLLALQLASSALSPRIIAAFFATRTPQISIGVFVFSYVFALGAGARVENGHVPQLMVLVAIMSNLIAIVVFFWFVYRVGTGLRPVAILLALSKAGRRVINEVYPSAWSGTPRGRSPQAREALAGPSRVIEYAGVSGTFLAFGAAELVEAARRADCVIELIPQVGDFVPTSDPLFRVYPADADIDPAALSQMVAFGAERTMEQDPAFAFRIMVDIASRALSPAINDPTTAVLALDQLHRDLLYLGRRQLASGSAADGTGRARLFYPTPAWEDFVALAVNEIRLFGANSIQVARRLRAMLEHLAGALPEPRVPPLHEELAMLQHAVERAFPEDADRRRAQTGDLQGIGRSSPEGSRPKG
ncbi:MAG TPA: DUF2254 domain-containing protein [Gemmatimonadales bacterium]|nr:DUF2254 domain-containing protein [Gemmatimonadales bacterium]